jgi:nitrite reductase/ring-hydroxylating ferredoxin subunit
MSERFPFPSKPAGWFAAAFSSEVPKGSIVTKPWFDGDIILFRDEFGTPHAADPHCPHQGAHLGYGGTIEGNVITCPFHGFGFNKSGKCISTRYDGKLPNIRLRTYSVVERLETILVYHGEGGTDTPGFELPEVDLDGWSAHQQRSWTDIMHPQDVLENSVDLGHMYDVHGIEGENIKVTAPFETDGVTMSTSWAVHQKSIEGKGVDVEVGVQVNAWGLGYYISTTTFNVLDAVFRTLISITPERDDISTLRASMSVKCDDPSISDMIMEQLGGRLAFGMEQDISIWRHKIYLPSPKLADGDGPIGPYRRWARQFYTEANHSA